MAGAMNKDFALGVSLVLSLVSLCLLFGVTWYFQSSLAILQQQVECDQELLFKLQEQINGLQTFVIIHDDKNGNKDVWLKQNDDGIMSSTDTLTKRIRKGDDGVQVKARSKRSSMGTKATINKGDVIVYADNIETIQDNGSATKGAKGDQGQKGNAGHTGPKGALGQKGDTGPKGVLRHKGMKGDTGGGTVYVRWGHDQCPLTAELVYTGRMGGVGRAQPGGGANPQCLPMDPSYLTAISGGQRWRATIYGAEYETVTDSKSHVHGRQDFDIPCAVCYTSNHSAVYMVPAKYTCPSGWTRQYYGYLMAEANDGTRHRTQYSCVDAEFKSVNGTSADKNGLLLYFVEGRCGSLPCPPYDCTRELSCAVCTK